MLAVFHPADALDHVAIDFGAAVVARSGAPQIVKEHPGKAYGLTRRIPHAREAAKLAPIPVEDEGTVRHTPGPAAGDEREQRARERERQWLLVLRHGAGEPHTAAHHRASAVEFELEPWPDCAERVAASEAREVGELGGVRHVRHVQLAEHGEEPRSQLQ